MRFIMRSFHITGRVAEIFEHFGYKATTRRVDVILLCYLIPFKMMNLLPQQTKEKRKLITCNVNCIVLFSFTAF